MPDEGELLKNAMSKEGDELAATRSQVGQLADPVSGVDSISVFDLVPHERLPAAKVDLAKRRAHVDGSVGSDRFGGFPCAEQIRGVNRIERGCVGASGETCDQAWELCLATIVERRIGGSAECASQCGLGVSNEEESASHGASIKDGG